MFPKRNRPHACASSFPSGWRDTLATWRKILSLGLPSLFAFATMTLTGTIVLIMIGDLGYLAIAVMGVVNIIMYNVWALFSGIGHTVNYLVAQNYGAGDMAKGMQRTQIALLWSIVIAVLVAAFGWAGSETVLRLTGGSEELVAAGTEFLQLRFYAMSFGIMSFVFHGFFRGVGNTRVSMVVSVVSNAIILTLCYVWTYGHLGFPALGLAGAGYAFLVGEALQLVICALVFWGLMHRPFGTRRILSLSWREAGLMARESGKLGLMEFSMSISMYIFTMFVARLGDRALAANEVSLNVMSLGFMPAFAFGTTATILVGQAVGRGDGLAARRAGTDTAILGALFLFLLGTVELIFAEPIARIYTDDPEVYKLAAFLISISAYLQIFDGLFNFYAGGLRGIGDTSFLMKVSLLLNFAYFVPVTWLFVQVLGWGSVGAWVALYTFVTLLGLAVTIRYYRNDWSAVRMREAQPAKGGQGGR